MDYKRGFRHSREPLHLYKSGRMASKDLVLSERSKWSLGSILDVCTQFANNNTYEMQSDLVHATGGGQQSFALSLEGRNMAREIGIIDNKLTGQVSFYFGLGCSLDSFMQWRYVESTHVNLEISK